MHRSPTNGGTNPPPNQEDRVGTVSTAGFTASFLFWGPSILAFKSVSPKMVHIVLKGGQRVKGHSICLGGRMMAQNLKSGPAISMAQRNLSR